MAIFQSETSNRRLILRQNLEHIIGRLKEYGRVFGYNFFGTYDEYNSLKGSQKNLRLYFDFGGMVGSLAIEALKMVEVMKR